ncbi:MAG: hypothetical protein RLN78_07190 [Phycisphaerales bacterium]|jgi:hypothetical protein|tara:strand:+ start:434 stop:766 length:333 start_codon:yes stop_codon:yes gene_type:complete
MLWLQKLRLRVFAVLVALTLAVIGVVGLFSVPVLPAIGVALVAAYSMVNSMTAKLSVITCAGCGSDLSNAATSTYGITCQSCGTTTQPYNHADNAPVFASFDEDSDSDIA